MTTQTERLSAALAERYRIGHHLGEGGMAAVYLAEDLKHDRKVAVKILKPELAAVLGAERFVQEIKTTASLSHPHILPLFDSGTADGFLYYVMPYIQGETIREKLNRETQFGVDEAVRIAREIADALDYAHRHGVIHRDIKPENVLLHDGRALVMDFGIALAVSAAAGGRMTETGLSLGTPHYMSPEQATAEKDLTPRSDVYSLASVLYEMLAGQPPHVGGSAQQIIMRIITDAPRPVTEFRRSVPPHVAAALGKALEKLPADRFESARAFSDALANAAFRTVAIDELTPTTTKRRRRVREGLLAAIAVVALALAARPLFVTTPLPPAPAKFGIALPEGVTIATGGGTKLALSRDGSQLVVVGQRADGARQLYVRRLTDPVAVAVRGTDSAFSPTFSPDGQSLLFNVGATPRDNAVAGIRLSVVPVGGGTPRTIADSARNATWADDDRVVFSRPGAIVVVSREGGPQRVVVASKIGSPMYGWPSALPGGKYALLTFWNRGATTDSGRLAVVSLTDGRVEDLKILGTNAHFVAPDRIVFGSGGNEVFVAPFSLRHHTVTGPPVLLLQGVWEGTGGAVGFDVSHNGIIAYHTGERTAMAGSQMYAVDRKGQERQLTRQQQAYVAPRLSPDGRRVAVTVGGAGPGLGRGVLQRLWILDIAAGTSIPFTTDSAGSTRGEWTRDGARILFFTAPVRDSIRLLSRPADLSAPAQVVARFTVDASNGPSGAMELAVGPPHGISVIRRGTVGASLSVIPDILFAPTDSMAVLRPLFPEPTRVMSPRVSPNGKLLAFGSTESGRSEVLVTPIPGLGPRLQISVDGGSEPVWSADGRTLFYRTAVVSGGAARGWMMAATISETPLRVVKRDTLFVDRYVGNVSHTNYDVFPDGRLLMLRADAVKAPPPSELFAVINWPQLLRSTKASVTP